MNQQLVAGLIVLALAGKAPGAGEQSPTGTGDRKVSATRASITLVGTDYPDYQEVVGHLRLLGVSDPDVLAETDAQYLRLSLADVEHVPFLPEGLTVYQTITTGVTLPVNLNFVVDEKRRAACFNPEVPYCADFDLLNKWLKGAGLKISDKQQAGELARFVVDLALSTVHHPQTFLYFRLSGSFGVQHWTYIKDIEDIYYEHQAPHRTEERRKEYAAITSRYRDVVRPLQIEETANGFRMHGFTYKTMRAAGDLREWDIIVHRDGQVDVDLQLLETGIGELYWFWAP